MLQDASPVEAPLTHLLPLGSHVMSTLLDLQDPVADEGTASSDDHDAVAIRAWARSRGYPIDDTPGVPPVVLRTYRRVHGC